MVRALEPRDVARRRVRLGGVALAVLLGMAGCGLDDEGPAGDTPTTSTVPTTPPDATRDPAPRTSASPTGEPDVLATPAPDWLGTRVLEPGPTGFPPPQPTPAALLLHADAVDAVVAIFAAMHETRFPLEEVRLITDADLDAPPTGDGNVTSAFVCRESRGGGWSEHAHGRALDVNPFHNPYDAQRSAGRVVLPELATAYTDRDLGLPGMLVDGDPVVAAVRDVGWHWGGDYRSLSDPMHLSATGR